MQLTVSDAAKALHVGEQSILRWIQSGALPAYRVAGEYRLNRASLLEWAAGKRFQIAADDASALPRAPDAPLPTLADTLRLGGRCDGVPGDTAETALAAFVDRMDLPESVQRPFLLNALLAREKLQSTGIGEGIAFPHLRNPAPLALANPMVFLAYLATPVDFRALDGKPVSILFCPLSPDLRTHLHVLSRLAYALRQPSFSALVRARAPQEELLAAADALDAPATAPAAP